MRLQKRTSHATFTAVFAVSTLFGVTRAAAQQPSPATAPTEVVPPETPPVAPPLAPSDAELLRRIDVLETRERERDARDRERAAQAALDKKAAEEKKLADQKKAVTFSAAPGKGFTVKTGDDSFSSTFRARIQMRNTYAHDAKGNGTNEINVRTMRLQNYGHILEPALKYYVQLAFGANDFDKDNASPIFDAFVEYTKVRDLNLRVGQYFVPFDRARTTREFALQFVDRQQPVRELTLDRDVGIMLSSTDFLGSHEVVAYNLFFGGGEGRNRFGGAKPGPLMVARVAVRPFGAFDDDQEGDLTRASKPRLAVGVGAAYNHGTNRANSTYGNTYAGGTATYYHGAADVVFKYGGLSIFAEALVRKAGRDTIDSTVNGAPVREYTRSGYGYFAQAGMMLTRHLEVVARWDQIFAMNGTDPTLVKLVDTQGHQVGGGFNVYLNGHFLKIQSDYFAIFGDDTTALNHLARVQLDATF